MPCICEQNAPEVYRVIYKNKIVFCNDRGKRRYQDQKHAFINLIYRCIYVLYVSYGNIWNKILSYLMRHLIYQVLSFNK